ncbi:MAG: hypothetical protein ACRYFX_00950 [Janthinobacterium lividum]
MRVTSLRQQRFYAALLFCLLLALVPRAGLAGDVAFWVRWATYSFEHGLGNVYQVPDNVYNPVFHYLLWALGQLLGSAARIRQHIYWVKALVLVFDFAGAFWAASLVPERSRRFGLALLLLLNIGYLYNTLIWVQVDAIYTCFAFGAVVLAVQQRPALSAVGFVLALGTKTQALMFLPPLLLLWLPQWYHQPRQLLRAGLAGAGAVLLLLAPFIWGGQQNALPRILEFNVQAVGLFPVLTMNAYNAWYLFTRLDWPAGVPDTRPLAGLTYHAWGRIGFFVAAALALAPLLAAAWQALRVRSNSPGLALVLLSAAMVPLLFTFFNTRMHERYWHAAVLFLAAYGFVRRDYLPYVLVSVAYFLQLEAVLRYLNLDYQLLLLRPRFIAGLFALLILLVFHRLYQLAPWRSERVFLG